MKKRIILALAGCLCLAVLGGVLARELQRLPVEGVLYFDTDLQIERSTAYEYSFKENQLKRVHVDGYSHVSNIAPAKDGFYCLGVKEADNALYVLFCQGKEARSALRVEGLVTHESQRWMEHFYAYQDGVIFRLPAGTGKEAAVICYADFATGEVRPLEQTKDCGSFVAVQGDQIFFSNRSGQVFRLVEGTAVLAFVGSNPVFIDTNTLLYSGKQNTGDTQSELFQYDLTSGQSTASKYHYDILKYHSGVEYEGSRLVKGDWLIGHQPGLLREWHATGTGRTTLVNIHTGRSITSLKLLWRDVEHISYSESAVYD